MDALQRLDNHPRETSIQDRLIAPSPEEMRRAIANGQCPFCGRRFKNIAAHTNRSHGVDRDQLKDMALIPRSHSVCTPELSAQMSERSKRLFHEDPDALRTQLTPKRTPREVSVGGKRVMRQRALSQGGLISQRERALRNTPESRARAAATHKARYYAKTADRDIAIAERARKGATLSELVAEFGVGNADVIRNACRRQGLDINFRSVMMQRPENAQWRIALMRGKQREHMAQVKAAKLARFAELGSTWEAVATLAAELNQTEVATRQFLRDNGIALPDGRQVSTRRRRNAYGRGVSPNGSGFSAKVTLHGKCHHLGTFRTPELAAAAAQAKRIELGIELASDNNV